ncbi:MAG TPA: AMP phosphorylase [Candidatus Woesearchaeota archaeon]|nr:MAG: AMP phosphorylase [Candidatus Woesearchaeota archaeon]HDD70731.1 AMP phosphorylase [Candidatus Woesearchaeota archaeon]
MKLKVKDVDIATGGVRIIILNSADAQKLDLHHMDRVMVRKSNRKITAVVDIAESEKAVPKGRIGLMEEVLDDVNAKEGDIVDIKLAKKPESVSYIKKKLDGKRLNYNQIKEIIKDITLNNLTDIELTTFVTSYYIRKSDMQEVADLTRAMIETGEKLNFDKGKIIVDLHSIGGVPNNRTTMIVVPILVAAGYKFPKTSSRAITSPAGTADTMEVLCSVKHSVQKLKRIIKKVGGFIVWGGSVNLAPADDRIIQVERPLSIDSEAQMMASIMAKKASVGSTHLLLEIPVGRETKIKRKSRAEHLKKRFRSLGRKMGIKVKTIICNGNEPVGNGIGPVLEARDVLWILKGDKRGPSDLKNKSLMMAGNLLNFVGATTRGRKMAKEILESGKAYEAFIRIVKAQGGKEIDPDSLKAGRFSYDVCSERDGYISGFDNQGIARVARIAGAPRDKKAGIYLYKHAGDKVKKGDKIFTIYTENKIKLSYAKEAMKKTKTYILRSRKTHL